MSNKNCENCIYYRQLGDERSLYACMYCHDTGKMRRCEPEICTKKTVLPYEVRTVYMKALRFRMAETITLEEIMNLIKSRENINEVIPEDISGYLDLFYFPDSQEGDGRVCITV